MTASDREALSLPCKAEMHWPFNLRLVEVSEKAAFIQAWVRTTSFETDGCGGRTDLHEVFGVLWAAVLRANGVASASLADMEGANPGEVRSRTLVFRQPFDGFVDKSGGHLFRRLQAHSAWAAHRLHEIFGMRSFEETEPEWSEDENGPWVARMRAGLGGPHPEEMFVERINPWYHYYRARVSGMTLVMLHPGIGAALRMAFRHHRPEVAMFGRRVIVSSGGMHNAVSIDAIRRGEAALRMVDDTEFAVFRGAGTKWGDTGMIVVPLEAHCVLVGALGLVVVPTDCGLQAFLRERAKWDRPARQLASIFGRSGTFAWADAVDGERLQDLARELLLTEPGVDRVRSAGPHNDRDRGRDLLVDVLRIDDPTSERPEASRKSMLVQVKSRRGKSISKSEVTDIADTMAWHRADAYLLVA